MSLIYEYLKEKATDTKYQNNRFYTVNNCYDGKTATERYTYLDIYNGVNDCIKLFKKIGFNKVSGKPVFLAVSSTAEDIIAMISLMELGAKPILIQKDSLFVLYNSKEYNNQSDFIYDVAPIIRYDKGRLKANNNILDAYQATSSYHCVADINEIKKVLSDNIDTTGLEEDNYDFALLTSGTTGKKKLVKLNEDTLVDNIRQNYELDSSELYMCQNPISSISGLIFTEYLPLIAKNKSVYICFYYKNDALFNDSDYNYDNLNLITSSSFFEEQYAQNKYYPSLNPIIRSKTNRITLLGSRVSTKCYDYLHNVFPNVKKGDIYGLYGRTENYGLISKVSENDVKLIYVRQKGIYPDRFTYSYDKKNVYDDVYSNGEIITYESDIEFNEDDFIQISNITSSNTKNHNVDLDEPLFGQIIVNEKATGDFGFRLDNKIYYLCRSEDLIFNKDHFVHINWFEKSFSILLNQLCPNDNVTCYCLLENNKINIYIPCLTTIYNDDNYERYQKKFLPLINGLNYEFINDVILFLDDDLRQGDEISKFKKYRLLDLKTAYSPRVINNKIDINIALNKELSKTLERDINIKYDAGNKIYFFPKKEFSSLDIAKIIYNYRVLEIRTDNNNYYLSIGDDFLFAKFDNKRKDSSKYNIEELKNKIEKDEIREYVVENYGYMLKQVYEIGTFYNEDNRLTAVILDEFTYPKMTNIHNPYHDMTKYRDKCEMIMRYLVHFSAYNYGKYNYFDNIEFSIDENNELYCDNVKYSFTYKTPDIYYLMRRILVSTKDNLKNSKQYKKKR